MIELCREGNKARIFIRRTPMELLLYDLSVGQSFPVGDRESTPIVPNI